MNEFWTDDDEAGFSVTLGDDFLFLSGGYVDPIPDSADIHPQQRGIWLKEHPVAGWYTGLIDAHYERGYWGGGPYPTKDAAKRATLEVAYALLHGPAEAVRTELERMVSSEG